MFKGITLILSCILFVSCGAGSSSKNDEVEELGISSHKKVCVGEGRGLCFVDSSNGYSFYDYIVGFDFVWGHSYRLRVTVTDVENPSADGSNDRYDLIETILDVEDDIGTVYEYRQIELLEATFTNVANTYYFLGQPFDCLHSAVCETLIGLDNSGGLVDVDFEYMGDGSILLTQWN